MGSFFVRLDLKGHDKISFLYYTRPMKTYEILFEKLYQQDDFVRGQELADQLGISRTAIWKGVQALEQQGLIIQSIKKKGYKLLTGDLIVPEQLAQELAIPVSYNPASSSTQLDAKAGLETGLTAPRLYLAPNQTGAKGRFGRSFFACPQGGIYMSLHLQPNLPHPDLPAYTLMVAASLVKAIANLTGIQCQIKWVNDIYLGQKKIAGILTEAITAIETGLVTDIIIGVGINFHINDFPDDLRDKAGSLFQEQPTILRQQLIAETWRLFFQTPEPDLVRYYKDWSLVLGREISFLEKGQSCTAKVLDISDKGELLIEFPSGQQGYLNSGEISLTSWDLTKNG